MKTLFQADRRPAQTTCKPEFEKLRERAIDLGSEAPLVSDGSLPESFRQLAESELVLLEKATYGEFVALADLEQAMKDLQANVPEVKQSEPSPEAAVRHDSAAATHRPWWKLDWLFRPRMASEQSTSNSRNDWNSSIESLREQIKRARLREAQHKVFVTEHLKVLKAEFDIQMNRARAALRISPVSAPIVEARETPATNTSNERTTEHETEPSLVQ
jgi:hypothetical protein